MKKQIKFLLGLSAGILLSGCVTFPGVGFTPADQQEDTANKGFIAKQLATIGRRGGFVRNVRVLMSEKGNRFLSVGYRSAGAGQMWLSQAFRKDSGAT